MTEQHDDKLIIKLYNSLDQDDRKIVNSLAIKKALNKNLTMEDIIAMFAAKRALLKKDENDQEVDEALKNFKKIIGSVCANGRELKDWMV